MRKKRSNVENSAEIIALVVKAPRTVQEVHYITGISLDAIRRHFNALKGEGLVQVLRQSRLAQGRGCLAALWTWAP